MVSWRLVVVVVLAVAAASSVAVAQPLPPVWPSHFVVNWTLFNVTDELPVPPYRPFPPDPPYQAGRGVTYYDWSIRSLTEIYLDVCVPIFPGGFDGPCQFLNTGNETFLIGADQTVVGPSGCCVFADPWFPPPPDFAMLELNYTATVDFGDYGGPVDFYETGPVEAQFGYGFTRQPVVDPATGQKYAAPGAFYFNAVTGWAQQNFFDFRIVRPGASVWDVPASCTSGAPLCNLG